MARITVELFGVPRLRAGRDRLQMEAGTVGEAFAGLHRAFPGLAGVVREDGSLHPAYRACRNGEVFVDSGSEPLAEGDVLLLLAADAGG